MMLGYEKTYEIVAHFYMDCVKFWGGQGEEFLDAHKLAANDLLAITTNPFSPRGEELNPLAKRDFLQWVQQIVQNVQTR